MNVINLPCSHELRQPEADPSFTGASHTKADEHQVQAAERFIFREAPVILKYWSYQ